MRHRWQGGVSVGIPPIGAWPESIPAGTVNKLRLCWSYIRKTRQPICSPSYMKGWNISAYHRIAEATGSAASCTIRLRPSASCCWGTAQTKACTSVKMMMMDFTVGCGLWNPHDQGGHGQNERNHVRTAEETAGRRHSPARGSRPAEDAE